MRLLLIVLLAITLVMGGCVKLGGSKVPAGSAGDQAGSQSQADSAGLAQNPGGMQSLPGAQSGLPSLQDGSQSGSIGGFSQPSLPAGVPVSPAIDQFNLSGQGGSQPSGVGELPPSNSGSASSSGMANLVVPPSNNAPAAGADTRPYFDKGGDLYADTALVDVGETVFLGWRVVNADNFTLDWGNGNIVIIPKDWVGTIVFPDVPGIYTYTLTAKNASGSVSQNVEVLAVSRGQREKYDKYSRCRTFMVYPQKIKKGEPVYVYWNVLDAQNVFVENDFTSSLSGKPDMRDIVHPAGMEQYWPYQDTLFRLTHGDGPYSEASYSHSDCFVEVR